MTAVSAEGIRKSMLQAADSRALEILAEARRQADRNRQDAGAKAARLIAAARQDGIRAADAVIAPQRLAARRAAREMLLRAQSEVVAEISARSRAAALEFRHDPDYPRLLETLEASARARLGPNAVIEPDPAGGVRARAGNLTLDYSLAALADHAVSQLAPQIAASVASEEDR